MIESIEFKNFKALRDTTLPLGPCTVIIGQNGSGKSTVLRAIEALGESTELPFNRVASLGIRAERGVPLERVPEVSVRVTWTECPPGVAFKMAWPPNSPGRGRPEGDARDPAIVASMIDLVKRIRVYSLDPRSIAEAVSIKMGTVELAKNGAGLAAVLDAMRDDAPDRFKAIESELGEWLPEFDKILFDRPNEGSKAVALRTRQGQHKVSASDLSQGTLIAIGLLTLAYHPARPSLIALEEPDRGLHPYLLRRVRDTLYRLSHPESCGKDRPPVQVIATTHSPYFVDLFRESPEEVVVANKVGLDVQFQRLTDQPQFHDVLGEAALGDAWFSGVLGGVPSGS